MCVHIRFSAKAFGPVYTEGRRPPRAPEHLHELVPTLFWPNGHLGTFEFQTFFKNWVILHFLKETPMETLGRKFSEILGVKYV